MSNLSLFAENGLEILIDTQTGEAFCSQAAYCRMSGKATSTISDRMLSLPEEEVKRAEVKTAGGIQGVRLISAKQAFKWAMKDNPELAAKMGECGATVFFHQLAGYKVKSEVANQETIDQRLDKILNIAEEYETLKACANAELPGLSNIMSNLAGQKVLPPITRFFTASDWLDQHAPELTRRQRSNFFKDIAASHRLLVDEPPVKVNVSYLYNNKHEFLFWQKLNQVKRHVSDDTKICEDFNKTGLTMYERSFIGKTTKIGHLVKYLGYSTKIDPRLTALIKKALDEAHNNKLLKVKRDRQDIKVNVQIVKFVKHWLMTNN